MKNIKTETKSSLENKVKSSADLISQEKRIIKPEDESIEMIKAEEQNTAP